MTPRRIAAALLLLAVPVAARLLAAAHPGGYPLVPLAPLRCSPQRPVTLTLIDDRSGSTWETDPLRRRERELAQLARWQTEGRCRLRVGAITFDRVVPPLPPVSTDQAGTAGRLAAALPTEAPESSSSLAPVLGDAAIWASRNHRDHDIVVIATDGMLSDMPDGLAAVRVFPGDVVVVALGGPLPTEWRAVQHRVAAVVVLDRQVGLGDVARAVSRSVNRIVSRDVHSQEVPP